MGLPAEATKPIIGQRDSFFEALFPIFERDSSCMMITADNGAPSLDQFAQKLPDQFLQVGIAEQGMIAIAAGLALEGKRCWCYAIAPFVSTRVHEFVKLDLCAMNLPITLLGVGAGLAYDNMGASHHTMEDLSIMRALNGLTIYSPSDPTTAEQMASYNYQNPVPTYIRFDRAGIPVLYASADIEAGLAVAHRYADPHVMIVATGIMVHQALKVAEVLRERHKIRASVLDVFRIAPFPYENFIKRSFKVPIVTLEEHFLAGGLGSIVCEVLNDHHHSNSLLRLGMPDKYVFDYGGRELLWKKAGLDVESVVTKICNFI